MTTQTSLLKLFDIWNDSLLSGDPHQVATLYAPDAILLPTVSNKVRHNHPEIADYFAHFLLKRPSGKILESNIRTFGDLAINSGIYEFTLSPDSQPVSVIQARFTFVYQKIGDDWLIIEHHSSAMPE